ncbi:hypothetical protein APS56_13710 [Pseudalgibacter alginicilyticus]|uniref:histidine kinase n=1 Tax=Pseudalgibacter alginicilyticus TaxID=1736674 RepID=A0A0P0DDI9_9FLAO|nr:two-component regulator propeller domain-containing protein [Pseudalgibacter alginicilyticus]ALJ06120.1 hypothetical protein APS56_13710 [Pseudalgibacter alginicilyticus]
MKAPICHIIIILIFFNSLKIAAQKDALPFKHLTNADGLSSNRINNIIEDGNGFIWFGTGDGLNQYDGRSVKVFKELTTSMALSPQDKNLLVGTVNGLELFDKNTQQFVHLNIKNSLNQTFDDEHIYSMEFGVNKQLFVGGDSFFIFNSTLTNFTKYPLPKDENGVGRKITSILQIDSGYVLLGTKNGIWQFDLKSGKYILLYREYNLGNVSKLFLDSKSNLWICTYSKGICFVKNADLKSKPVFYTQENGYLINNRVIDIVEDKEDVFFIANIEGGLVQFDKKNNKTFFYQPDIFNVNSLSGKALTALIKDSQNNIWIGTYNSGVDFLDRHRKKFEHYQINFREDGLFNNNIRAMFQDSNGSIWIGTKEGGGLSKFNRSEGTFTHYKPNDENPSSLGDDYVFSIEELDPKHLMIGTLKGGLDILNIETGDFVHNVFNKDTPVYNMVYVIHKDMKGNIWMDYGSQFCKFLPQKKTIEIVKGVVRVKCITDEDEDHIWLGTYESGLFLFNTTTKELTKYDVGSSEIISLKKDVNGDLWIGTKSGLICKQANTTDYVTYTVKDGLVNNQVLGLLIDNNNNIWASTTNGLSKFDTKTQKFRNYDFNDGLQGNEFERYASLKTKEGELMFGGRNGFNIFNPDEIIDNPNPPKVKITSFKLFNKAVDIGSEDSPLKRHISQTKDLKLNHEQSVLTFGFVALNYSSPEKNEYAYILEGFDKDWNYIDNKQEATYTNLPAGNYVFKVKASNSDGYWNEEGASINLKVLPPWWKTPLAYFVYFIIILLLLLTFYYFMTVYFNLKNNLRFEQLEKEKHTHIYQAKLQFFTNISHEFRTPLTLIIDPLDKLLNTYTNDANLQKHLNLINANAKRLLRLINQLMDFRKVEKGMMTLKVAKYNIVDVTKLISDCFVEKAEDCNIDYTVTAESDEIPVYFDLEKYDIILHNLLFNAFKFTPNNGQVGLYIGLYTSKYGVQYVEITVKDDGKGISEENVNKVFEEFYQIEQGQNGTGIGLSLTKKLVELHKGTIGLDSKLGVGSCFTIRFLLGNTHFEASDLIDMSNNHTYEMGEFKLETIKNKIGKTVNDAHKAVKHAVKILLVEDNEEILNYLKENLQNNYSIFQAKDGDAGLKECLRIAPDLIISDVMMPIKNGIEMCRDLKSDIRISHTPVILLTAKTSFENKKEGLKTGADVYIEKPFSMELLELQIVNLLESRKKLRERFSNELNILPQELSSSSADDRFLNKAVQIIESHLSESEFSVEDFIKEIGMSRSSLHIKLKALTDKSTTEFIRSIRLKAAAVYLKQTNQSISEISYNTGFASPQYFSKCFKKVFGKLPTDYRNE